LYINVDFEVLLNAEKEPILGLDVLQTGKLSEQNWSPRASGSSIQASLADELEAVWFQFLTTRPIRNNPFIPSADAAQKTYSEGTPNQVLVTKYERNPHAKRLCLEHYGYTCVVCGFNFENAYGELGREFIHVHHLTQVASIRKTYDVDPVKDLRPVCPNCHAMIHRNKKPLGIEELQTMIHANSNKD
jgi:5-methylcytosine-specific restriction protein A